MWHDPQHNVLIYDTDNPEILKIDGAKQLVNGYVGIPINLHSLQHLAFLGFPIVPPLASYDWPRNVRSIPRPFDAQVATSNFLAAHPHACCLSDMGTGKTLAALWAADAVMTDHKRRTGERIRTLVVAPLSTLKRVWEQAIFSHFMRRRSCVVLHGTAEKRTMLLQEDVDFFLLNHDGIKVGARMRNRRIEMDGFAKALSVRQDIALVIVDEVRAFSDYRTARSRMARTLLRRDYLWGLTGTPTPNAPTDAYGIALLINGARGESFASFRARTMMQVSTYKWVARQGANMAVRELLQPSIRFAIEDCADLPELIVEQRDVELTDEQERLLRELKHDLITQIKTGTITAANEAVLRNKMLQVCCGAVYDGDHVAYGVDCHPRIAEVLDIIDEAGKLIIFCPFVSAVRLLNAKLDKCRRAVIMGETPVKERNDILREFQETDELKVLIAHPETIAHGLTLTAAATIVWYGPVDKTESYIQANKRIHRPGQTRTCVVVQLSSTKLEREVYRRLEDNESMQGALLKLVEEQSL